MYLCKMDLQKINIDLYNEAKALRMCEKVQKAWYDKTYTADELITMFHQNFDFCAEHRWPSKETMKRFDATTRHAHGVLVDEKWSLLNPNLSVIVGSSVAKVRYNAFSVGKVYVFNNSKVEITAKGHAIVSIHLYDETDVSVTTMDYARVTIMRHSKESTCKCYGKATLKECS